MNKDAVSPRLIIGFTLLGVGYMLDGRKSQED